LRGQPSVTADSHYTRERARERLNGDIYIFNYIMSEGVSVCPTTTTSTFVSEFTPYRREANALPPECYMYQPVHTTFL
jgi:hypothetical protein